MARTARRRAASSATERKRSSRSKAGPRVSDLILKAVAASQESKGVSLVALKQALAGYGYDVKKNDSRVKLALRSLVKRGLLVQTIKTGARRQLSVSKRDAVRRPAKKRALKKSKSARRKRATKSASRRVKGSRRSAKKRSAKRVTSSRRRKVKAAKRKAAKRKRSKVRRRRAVRKK
ncbi:histone H1.11R-like [Clarias gariepinus]|uniref:histone H1.11R-like n=1 Tax=Clarias gariepinus TaxID=13013 RepID=UPI00234C8038|nr:histone H1.11R-like [Clarias gariepinus]